MPDTIDKEATDLLGKGFSTRTYSSEINMTAPVDEIKLQIAREEMKAISEAEKHYNDKLVYHALSGEPFPEEDTTESKDWEMHVEPNSTKKAGIWDNQCHDTIESMLEKLGLQLTSLNQHISCKEKIHYWTACGYKNTESAPTPLEALKKLWDKLNK